MKISQIRKRDGSVVVFVPGKVEQAIHKALAATRVGDRDLAADLARRGVRIVAQTVEAAPYVTVGSEYVGGCLTGTCPF